MLYEGPGLREQVEEMDVVEHEATAWYVVWPVQTARLHFTYLPRYLLRERTMPTTEMTERKAARGG